jgi:p70 ribosomal S6 kinase
LCALLLLQSVENFDKIWTDQPPLDSPCGTPTDPSAADAFTGFTYVAPSFVTSSMAALALKQQQQADAASAAP